MGRIDGLEEGMSEGGVIVGLLMLSGYALNLNWWIRWWFSRVGPCGIDGGRERREVQYGYRGEKVGRGRGK